MKKDNVENSFSPSIIVLPFQSEETTFSFWIA